ncbi:hypothetical protein D9M69_522260 [compost metagenome]
MQAPAQVRHRVERLEAFQQARPGDLILEAARVVQGVATVFQVTLLTSGPVLRADNASQRALQNRSALSIAGVIGHNTAQV